MLDIHIKCSLKVAIGIQKNNVIIILQHYINTSVVNTVETGDKKVLEELNNQLNNL